MKRASLHGIGVTTLFYLSLGFVGYAAFGDDVPGNILTGFYEPFWLIDMGNIAVLVHLVGAYQVFTQPIFAFYESWCARKWPNSGFFHSVHALPLPFRKGKTFRFTFCKLILRTGFVSLATTTAAMFPFFNAVLGLLGSISFWPLTVYYPVAMHMSQAKIKTGRKKWMFLQAMSLICLLVSLVAAVGSVVDIVKQLRHAKLFQIQYRT